MRTYIEGEAGCSQTLQKRKTPKFGMLKPRILNEKKVYICIFLYIFFQFFFGQRRDYSFTCNPKHDVLYPPLLRFSGFHTRRDHRRVTTRLLIMLREGLTRSVHLTLFTFFYGAIILSINQNVIIILKIFVYIQSIDLLLHARCSSHIHRLSLIFSKSLFF